MVTITVAGCCQHDSCSRSRRHSHAHPVRLILLTQPAPQCRVRTARADVVALPNLDATAAADAAAAAPRRGADVKRLLLRPGTVLSELAGNVIVVEDPVTSDVSSTKLREQVRQQQSIDRKFSTRAH